MDLDVDQIQDRLQKYKRKIIFRVDQLTEMISKGVNNQKKIATPNKRDREVIKDCE